MSRSASIADVWRSRGLVWRLARAHLRDRYSGTAFGVVWALLQPALVMAVFWFVFAFGLKIGTRPGEAPFVASLIVALTAWFWFADAVSGGADAVTGKAFLVKKVAFPLEILPLVPVVAALIVHLGLLLIVAVALTASGDAAGWRLLLLPIYMAALAALAVGLAYWLAALNVFQRDVAQTIGLLLQVWFWLTPIVWSFGAFPPGVSQVLGWNPMAYVISGYRHALLADAADAPTIAQGAATWAFAILLAGSGVAFYRQLRSDFADLL